MVLGFGRQFEEKKAPSGALIFRTVHPRQGTDQPGTDQYLKPAIFQAAQPPDGVAVEERWTV